MGEQAEYGRARAAGALPLPGSSAVAGGQYGSQRPHGPAVLVIDESHCRKRRGNARGKRIPRTAGVGRVKNPRAGRSRDPGLRTAHGQGGEIEMPHGFGGKIARWCIPEAPGIYR